MKRLHALDALRGLAAVLVMIGHIRQSADASWYTGMTGLCVDFFLMLSGYVMARSYEDRLRGQTEHRIGAGTFLAKRFVRLWPVAATGVMLAVLLEVLRGAFGMESVGVAATALLFLPWLSLGPGQSWLFPLNGPRWSLFAELAINWFHAAALARRSTGQMLGLIALCGVPLIAISTMLGDWPHAGKAPEFVGGMLRLLIAYLIGVVLFRHFRDRRVLKMSLSGLCMVLVAAVYLGGLVHPPLFGALFLFALCPLMVAGGAGLAVPERAERWCAAAGTVSFPLYAVHVPLSEIALFAGIPDAAVLGLALVLTAAVIAVLALRQPRAATQGLAAA